MASVATKNALLGEKVDIINCEKAVISGNRRTTLKTYRANFLERGSKSKGPFIRKTPDRFVKRAIRGMLPYKKEKGKKALQRITCYIGTPDNLKGKETENLDKISLSKLEVMKYVTVKIVCRELGGKL